MARELPKIAFVGDPNDINPKTDLGEGPEVLEFYGQDFPKGEFVVPDNERIFKKASGNSHFVVEGQASKEPLPKEVKGVPERPTVDQIKHVLTVRKVDFAGNASRAHLEELLDKNGGAVKPDELA